jgi:hypothetical protein
MSIPLILIEGNSYTRILHKQVTNVIEVNPKLTPAELEEFRKFPKAFIESCSLKD